MHLKVLLPYKVFTDVKDVQRIVAETSAGSYGFLPNRLDCTAALVAGILQYEIASNGVKYIAISEGILVKAGDEVLISVRSAMGNTSLGELKNFVDREFQKTNDIKNSARKMNAGLESSLMRSIQQLVHER